MNRTVLVALVVALAVGAAYGGKRAWSDYRDRTAAEYLGAHARPGDIYMYSATYCPFCDTAKAWLDRHKVPYEVCETDRDKACEQRFLALRSPATPTLIVRGDVQIGFRPARMAEALR